MPRKSLGFLCLFLNASTLDSFPILYLRSLGDDAVYVWWLIHSSAGTARISCENYPSLLCPFAREKISGVLPLPESHHGTLNALSPYAYGPHRLC